MARLLLACCPSGVARHAGERDELFYPFVEGLREEFSKLRKKLGKQKLESRFVGAIFFLFNPLFYYYYKYIGTRDLFTKFRAYVFSVQNSRFSVCEINITFIYYINMYNL
jgi:hypothetical protein